jgi:hypothetical protein
LKNAREVVVSVLPVGVLVTVLALTAARIDGILIVQFWIGSAVMIVGLALFLMGADVGMQPMGEFIGASLTRSRSLWFISFSGFLFGAIVTLQEPDLQVLAAQVYDVSGGQINRWLLIAIVSIGVGLFLVAAILRIILRVRLSVMLIVLYIIVFALAAFTSPEYLAVAFDAGGVTTGPMTVPFILAMGVGISAVRAGKTSEDDSFGFLALSSIGPVIAVLAMGIVYRGAEMTIPAFAPPETGLVLPILREIPGLLREIGLALVPLLAIFIVFQVFRLKIPRKRFRKILSGLLYAGVGLAIFLAGVNAGLMPAARALGQALGALEHNWILIPAGALLGFAVVFAEPAVYVLNAEVERVTGGHIKRRVMLITLSIGVALGVGLAMMRILYGVSLWWYIVPGYLISLILSRMVPQVFVGIAFDSGGVAAGTMTATFLLAICQGAADMVPGADILRDAFGVVAMVAMMPLLAIQVLGMIYTTSVSRKARLEAAAEARTAGSGTQDAETEERDGRHGS